MMRIYSTHLNIEEQLESINRASVCVIIRPLTSRPSLVSDRFSWNSLWISDTTSGLLNSSKRNISSTERLARSLIGLEKNKKIMIFL